MKTARWQKTTWRRDGRVFLSMQDMIDSNIPIICRHMRAKYPVQCFPLYTLLQAAGIHRYTGQA